MVFRVEELEQNTHEIFGKLGSNQTEQVTISFVEQWDLGNSQDQCFEFGRDLYKIDLDGLYASWIHTLQNKKGKINL